jgi:hypothetical protein
MAAGRWRGCSCSVQDVEADSGENHLRDSITVVIGAAGLTLVLSAAVCRLTGLRCGRTAGSTVLGCR